MTERGDWNPGLKARLSPWHLWLTLTGLLSVSHFATFNIANTPLVTDVRLYVYFAAQKAAGAVPYRDFVDIKTPLATFAGAALIRAGEIFQVDALTAIRIGYLAVAAAMPLLYFIVHIQLRPDDGVSGFWGAFAFCGFPLLGFLPSVGNIPKLLMAFFAAIAVILIAKRRWFLAGATGALACLDWQIGILVLLASITGSAFDGGNRKNAALRVCMGALIPIAPFFLYFWFHGALVDAFQQIVICAFVRGRSASLDLLGNIRHISRVVEMGCDGHEWLVVIAIIGACVFPLWIRRNLRKAARSQVCALAVYHYGIVAYSLVDFQRFGDLFILLHTVAFFLGIAFVELYAFLRFAQSQSASVISRLWRRGRLSIVLMCVVVLAMTRPSFLRAHYSLPGPGISRNASLDDQREVNQAFVPYAHGKKLAFVKHIEQLFLGGLKNDIPYANWAAGDRYHARLSAAQSQLDTWDRIIRTTCPEVFAPPGKALPGRGLMEYFEPVTLASNNGAYQMTFYVLKESVGVERYKNEYCSMGDSVALN
jgi:hypothetical protein